MRARLDVIAVSGCLLAAATLSACGESGVGATGHSSSKKPRATQVAAVPGPAAVGAPGVAKEVADPQESSSFPAPASVHHKPAATPAQASKVVIAAGAPSDAEVRQELAQMHAAERTAVQTQQRRLTAVPGGESIGGNGTIPIPTDVPEVVQKVIAGANAIADFPYVFGGGHASFVDNAYDCSGSVSYALAAAGLLGEPETSGTLESWGAPGPGRYITVYANAGHTYMYVDGMLYDTAGRSGVYASRWQVGAVDNSGYVARHYPGLQGTAAVKVDPGAILLSLPFALDGESANSNNTAIAVISLVSIVSGYLLLAALWYFVFREKAREKRRKGPGD